jgi:phosphoglycolate phosphatase-like HAD superfamily hydrolase
VTIKILSDFDGVWTDQALEAENVKIYMAAEAARYAEVSGDEARADFRRFEVAVQSAPAEYGWAPDGRITAYVDEDPFCVPNSIAMYLERVDDPQGVRYRDAILAGGEPSLSAFADRCFLTATADYREQHPPALVPHAKEALEALHEAGAEIVVVSNSSSEKIVGWFQRAGVDAGTDHDSYLRVRGQAGKQVLGPGDQSIEVAGRAVYVDRPQYRAVIEAENPDLVVGDVFSLDLALPHVLRREGRTEAPRELVLRRHRHTPTWVHETRAEGAIDTVVDDVVELVHVVARLH